MKTQCPHCKSLIDTDDEWYVNQNACPKCYRDFSEPVEIKAPQSIPVLNHPNVIPVYSQSTVDKSSRSIIEMMCLIFGWLSLVGAILSLLLVFPFNIIGAVSSLFYSTVMFALASILHKLQQ